MKSRKTSKHAVSHTAHSVPTQQMNGNLKSQNVALKKSRLCHDASSGPRSSSMQSGVLDLLSPFKIALVTFSLRLIYVLDRANWWMIHPDEVFQSIEIGHIEAYGYGFRSYEFSPLTASANETTRYRQILLDSDMAALRSPIFPYFYTLAHFISFHIGFRSNPYLISRIAHILMTSLLPATVYHYVINLFHCRHAATLAAILTASSVHLNVYGTRCFVQSFLAPVTFLALSLVLNVTQRITTTTTAAAAAAAAETAATAHNKKGDNNCTNGHLNTIGDENNNSKAFTHKHKQIAPVSDFSSSSSEIIAKLNSYNTAVSLRFNILAKNNKNQLNGHTIISSSSSSSAKLTHCSTAHSSHTAVTLKCFILGFLVGLTSYIRPDVLLVHTVHFVILLPWQRKRCLLMRFPVIILGISMSLLLGVLADRMFYGEWVVSPYNWLKINVVSDLSTGIFGKMSPGFYVYKCVSQDLTTSVLCLISVVTVFAVYFRKLLLQDKYNIKYYNASQVNDELSKKMNLDLCTRVFLCWSFLVLIYSLHGHKEIRFIHDAIILAFVFISGVMRWMIHFIMTHIVQSKKDHQNVPLVGLILVLFLSQWHQYPKPENSSEWAYQNSEDTHSINACLEFVSQQEDAQGLFLDSTLFMTGGMAILHRNIPVLAFLLDGFFEFGFDSRLNSTSSNPFFPLGQMTTTMYSNSPKPLVNEPMKGNSSAVYSVSTFTRASNYVSHLNAPAVVRIILNNKNYNYLILRKDRRFLEIGFEEVFQTGNQRVLRRTLADLSHISKKIPLGSNATVLLHEGDVLSYLGRYQEAVERFQACLAIQSERVAAYFPLYTCLLKLGRKQEASRVLSQCYRISSKEQCTKARPLTRIH